MPRAEALPLAGMAALVTGGSGGIGSASGAALARDGAAVLLMGRRSEALAEARAQILAGLPDALVECHAGDALSEQEVRTAVDRAFALRGRLDIVVAAVGGGGFRPILMHDAESFRAEIEFNAVSAFLAVRHGAPRMTGGGSIVCISSTA